MTGIIPFRVRFVWILLLLSGIAKRKAAVAFEKGCRFRKRVLQNPNASDRANQIFTTLANVFVSVVSFCFGSSVASSAASGGARAAKLEALPGPDKTPPPQPLKNPLVPSVKNQGAIQVCKAVKSRIRCWYCYRFQSSQKR